MLNLGRRDTTGEKMSGTQYSARLSYSVSILYPLFKLIGEKLTDHSENTRASSTTGQGRHPTPRNMARPVGLSHNPLASGTPFGM